VVVGDRGDTDVASAGRLLREEAPLEFGQDHLVGLRTMFASTFKRPAVRHPEGHLVDAEPAGILDQCVEERNERLPALEREALRRGIAELQELLEALARIGPRARGGDPRP